MNTETILSVASWVKASANNINGADLSHILNEMLYMGWDNASSNLLFSILIDQGQIFERSGRIYGK